MTAEPYCYADMIPTAEAIERLCASMWRTAPVVTRVAEVRRIALWRPPLAGGIGFGLHRAVSARILYAAVVGSQLALYAWPTRREGHGARQPEEAVDTLRPIPVALIERLRPLHRGLPSSFVGGRQPILKQFAGIAATDVPVFVRTEFERWLKDERHKGYWATQRPLDAEDRRARMSRRPGRPSIQGEVEQAILTIVADGKWTRGDPVSGLHRLVRAEQCKANEDTVRRVLDRLYIRTGEMRYRCRFFDRRNLGLKLEKDTFDALDIPWIELDDLP